MMLQAQDSNSGTELLTAELYSPSTGLPRMKDPFLPLFLIRKRINFLCP